MIPLFSVWYKGDAQVSGHFSLSWELVAPKLRFSAAPALPSSRGSTAGGVDLELSEAAGLAPGLPSGPCWIMAQGPRPVLSVYPRKGGARPRQGVLFVEAAKRLAGVAALPAWEQVNKEAAASTALSSARPPARPPLGATPACQGR